MPRDRYQIDKLFLHIQPLSSKMDPQLAAIHKVLDDDELYHLVRGDLEKRYPKSAVTGRPSTPAEVILRMLVVKHLYNLSYEKTDQYVSDSLVLRAFPRLYLEPVPDDTVPIRWANTIEPQRLEALHARTVTLATELPVAKGRRLHTDGTVVESNIHHPTDGSLLCDSVRVLSRALKRAPSLLSDATGLSKQVFRRSM